MAGRLGKVEVSKVLCFSPHPDDTEIMCGGLVAQLASQGAEVILCVVTNGACGSNDPQVQRDDLISTRQIEQRNAALLMGVSEVIFFGYEDGFLEDSHELRTDIIREVRRHKPDVVIGPDPAMYYLEQWYVNHPDHRRLGEAILAAVNPGISTVPLYRSELFDKGFLPHTLKACLLYGSLNADLFVDIGDFIESKIAALDAHVSQREGWGVSAEAVKGLGALSAGLGKCSFTFAEAYKALFFSLPEAASSSAGSAEGEE